MKIVIVGGGFSGYLTALMINKIYPSLHDITLVDSEKIKTIGVGEGSTGFMRGIMNNEGFDWGNNDIEFMKYANAIPKLGINFKEWRSDFLDFIEPLDSPNYSISFNTYPLLLAYKAHNIPIYLSTVDGRLCEYGLSSYVKKDQNVIGTNNHAYHFDSFLAGKYLKNKVKKNIKIFTSSVNDIVLDSDGYVKSLIMDDGKSIYGDFFIDASGFSRIFMKKMNVKFIEYKELTLNSAIPFRLDLSEKNSNEKFMTTAWAQKYGWMWMIPRADSIGCGYIYDDNYIDKDLAKKEIEEKLEIEISVEREIKFKAGRLENFWNKNVLSIGLASSFLEPLEATSIHGTISQISNFIFYYLKDTVSETVKKEMIDEYNNQTSKLIDNFKTFILLHYVNTRQDTFFWKKMKENAHSNAEIKKIINISKTRLLNDYDLDTKSIFGSVPSSLLNVTLCCFDVFSKESAQKELSLLRNKEEAASFEKHLCEYIEKNNWITNKDFLNYLQNIKQDI